MFSHHEVLAKCIGIYSCNPLHDRCVLPPAGNPSGSMLMAGVTGSTGKTTVCWLLRSIFERCGLLTGLLGDIEYSIAHNPLDVDGNLWKPSEPDPTENRRCTAPYHITPYKGKYSIKDTLPDLLKVGDWPCQAGHCGRWTPGGGEEMAQMPLELVFECIRGCLQRCQERDSYVCGIHILSMSLNRFDELSAHVAENCGCCDAWSWNFWFSW